MTCIFLFNFFHIFVFKVYKLSRLNKDEIFKLQMNKTEIKEKIRLLLLNHATYIKFYVDALQNNQYDSGIVLDMLLSIQEQIGSFLKEFIGYDDSIRLIDFLKQRVMLIGRLTEQKSTHNDIMHKLIQIEKQIEKLIQIPHNELNRHNQYVIAMIKAQQQNDTISKYTIFDAFYEYMISFSDLLSTKMISIQAKNNSLINSLFFKFPAYVFSAWGPMDHYRD